MEKMIDFLIAKSQWIVFIGGFISIGGAFLATKKSSRISRQNLALTEEVKRKTDTINKFQTGGNSYCVLEVAFHARTNIPIFFLKHKGDKIPLKQVQLAIEDLGRRNFLMSQIGKIDYMSKEVSDIIAKTEYMFQFDALRSGQLIELPIPFENNQEHLSFRIWIDLDNGRLFETLQVQDFNKGKRVIKMELKKGDDIIEKRES